MTTAKQALQWKLQDLRRRGRPRITWRKDLESEMGTAAVRSVTLNLANKFSQCTISVAEHYDLFSDVIILRQA